MIYPGRTQAIITTISVLQYSSQVLGLESDSSPVFGDLDLDSDLKAKDALGKDMGRLATESATAQLQRVVGYS
jgi:hypothetical protein